MADLNPLTCPICGAPLNDRSGSLCAECSSRRRGGRPWGPDAETQSASPELASDEETAAARGPSAIRARHDEPSLAPGQRFGSYRIARLLGRGGMGEVYEAEHVEHGRRVAIKILNQALGGEKDRARFMREGQLAASVNHPNTVYIFGAEEIDGTPVIAMELVAAGTLKDRVQREGPMSPREAVSAVLQIIEGLDAARVRGILHRDIKPSNCFVDRDGTVKIGDFGLSISTMACEVTPLTTTGTFHGTPQFASPEQLKGERLDVRSDIYSVGATLYYLLTGRPPFDDTDLLALVSRIAAERPRSPRDLRSDVPPELAEVVLGCLAKDRTRRPHDYAALVEQLRPFGAASGTGPPAPLGLRVVAAAADVTLFYALWVPVSLAVMFSLSLVPGGQNLIRFGPLPSGWFAFAAFGLYLAVTATSGGGSFGQRLMQVRVVGVDQRRVALPVALLRALLFVGLATLTGPIHTLLRIVVTSDPQYAFPFRTDQMLDPSPSMVALVGALLVVLAIAFAPARRRNGYAAVHDLLSRTRVVRRPTPLLDRARRPTASQGARTFSEQRIGPYRLLAEAPGALPRDVVAGYDEALRRPVWIRPAAPDAPPTSSTRRTLSRKTRVRWLDGARNGRGWDAFEAIDGMPLSARLETPQGWSEVRGWLLDLARELQAWLTGPCRISAWTTCGLPPTGPCASRIGRRCALTRRRLQRRTLERRSRTRFGSCPRWPRPR